MLQLLPQIIWFSILTSSIYALVGIGGSLIFGILEFINFAQGEYATVGAYLFYELFINLHLPIWLSFILVIFLAGIIGMAIERFTFRPVSRCHDFIPLVVAMGLSVFIQALIILLFGGGVQTYQTVDSNPISYTLMNGNLIITQSQILIVVTSAVLMITLFLFLKKTKTGKAIRAVSDSKDTAAILGVNINKVLSIIFALSMILASVGGLLIASEQNLNPTMGLDLGLKAFAAIILGGVGNLPGTVAAAFILGFSENLIVGLTSINDSYKEVIVFAILILILFFKPNGLFGGRLEEDIRK